MTKVSDLIQFNDEVEINQKDIFLLDKACIKRIKRLAQENSSGKYRTCVHQSEKDNVHEMVIVHSSGTYVRPHKHKINGESLQFIEGVATAIIFNDDGSIKEAFKVSDATSGYTFYYSMGNDMFHMLIIESEFLVFKETIKGPFIREDTIFPDWAPDGSAKEDFIEYIDNIKRLLEKGDL